MADARVRITKRLVDSLGASGIIRHIQDTDVLGFAIKISALGHITYILRYRIAGRQRKYKIGVHGAPWTPETARAEAQILLGKVRDGIDPQEDKIADREEQTVSQLCDTYLAEGLYAAKESSIRQARNNIENYIKPLIGSRRVSKIVRTDIEQLLRDIAVGKTRRSMKAGHRGLSRVRGGKGAANQAVTTLSAVLGLAVVRGLRLDNPAIGVKKFPGKKKERFLSPAELARLGEALAAAEALGVGRRERLCDRCAAPPHPDGLPQKRDSQTEGRLHRCLSSLPAAAGQQDRRKVVHLRAPAIRIIAAMPEVVGNPYLLPGKKDGTHLTDLQAVWERIRRTAGLEDVRVHDLRHSFASIGASTGDSMLIINALLGHRSAKTTERYTHLLDHPLKSAAKRISDEIAKHFGDAMTLPAANDTNEGEPFGAFWASQPEGEAHPSDPVLGAVIRTRWLDTRAAAAVLSFTVGTMQTYRWMGTGPAFRKIGRRVVYSADALAAWQKLQSNASVAVAA